MKKSRQKEMAELIAQRQSMTMEELHQTFGMSMNTIRSDVASLVRSGAVEKIYGGVRSNQQKQVPLFTSRAMQQTAVKQRIARAAEALILDRDIVYIDAGTTTMHLIDFLSPEKHITVVTPNLSVIVRAAELPNVELVVLPGVLNRRTNALLDAGTFEFLSRYQHAKAFMGASGVTEDGGLSVSSYTEFELKRTAVRQSRQCFLLVDSSKFGEASLMAYGQVGQMTAVITDSSASAEFQACCTQQAVELRLV